MILGLLFTRGVSLKFWVESGLFYREKIVYEKLLNQDNISEIIWFTYGSDDKELGKILKEKGDLKEGISIIPKPKLFYGSLGNMIYSFLLPIIRYSAFSKCQIIKSNQMDGSWAGIISKLFHRNKVIIRTGYTASFNAKMAGSKLRYNLLSKAEKFVYKFCDIAVTTNQSGIDYIKKKYNAKRSLLIPNFIETDKFKSTNDIKNRKDRILFVGRISIEKNLKELLIASKATNVGVDIIGHGDLKTSLELLVKQEGIDCNFLGRIPNDQLPQYYNRYTYFALVSLYENMPKTLIEAMACGCVCIGTDVNGIDEILEDGQNGFLSSSTSSTDLSKTILRAVESDHETISKNGIKEIKQRFSLEAILDKEIKTLGELSSTK